MGSRAEYLNRAVTAFLAGWLVAAPVLAAGQQMPADQAKQLRDLKSDDYSTWRKAESDLLREWSNSGSPAMDLLLQRANKAMKAGDYRTAVAHLTALIDHAPDFEDAYNARAEAYYHLGLFGPAVQDIGKALTLNPNDFRALQGLGLIFETMDKPKDALAAFKMARDIHPHLKQVREAIQKLEAEAAGQEL
jgi:tetratricopeptide (TPR) repeat protein